MNQVHADARDPWVQVTITLTTYLDATPFFTTNTHTLLLTLCFSPIFHIYVTAHFSLTTHLCFFNFFRNSLFPWERSSSRLGMICSSPAWMQRPWGSPDVSAIYLSQHLKSIIDPHVLIDWRIHTQTQKLLYFSIWAAEFPQSGPKKCHIQAPWALWPFCCYPGRIMITSPRAYSALNTLRNILHASA